MFVKLFLVVSAAVGICTSAPLEARAPVISATTLEGAILGAQVAYQSISDHVKFVGGPNAPPGIAKATLTLYSKTVNAATANELTPKAGKAYGKAIQFALCNSVTTATLQILEAQALLRSHARKFTKKQRAKMISIVKKDRKEQISFAATFAKYTPVCKSSIAQNGRLLAASLKDTEEIYQAV